MKDSHQSGERPRKVAHDSPEAVHFAKKSELPKSARPAAQANAFVPKKLLTPQGSAMTFKSLSQSIGLTALLLCRLTGQTGVPGGQIHLAANSHSGSSYNIAVSDCGKLLSFSNPSAATVTLPQALAPGCWIDIQNIGPGIVTITPTASTIDGLSSAQLIKGEGLHMISTGTALLTVRGGNGASAWTNSTPLNSATPVFDAGGASGITFLLTLTGNIASSSLIGPKAGIYVFAVTQDGIGGHTFVWPSTVTNAPLVDTGANNTTYLLCQYDGSNCVGLGNFVAGTNITPGVTIPGRSSGSNTISTPANAGFNSTTNLAPNGTTVIPNACVGQVVQSIAATGSITCGAGGGGSSGSTPVVSPYPVVADGAAITWNLQSVATGNGSLTLSHATATRALNVSNLINGGTYTLVINQDSTGGAAMTLGTGCTWKVIGGGAGAITVTATPNSADILTFTYDGTYCYTSLQARYTAAAGSAYALISSATPVGVVSGNATTAPIDTTGANLLIVYLVTGNSGAPSGATLTDSYHNTWTALSNASYGPQRQGCFFYAKNAIVGPNQTFTAFLAGSAAYLSVFASAWSGANATAPFDQQSVNNSGLADRPGSITPSSGGELIITGLSEFNSGSDSIQVPAGFTLVSKFISGSYEGGAVAYAVQSSAAAVNPAWRSVAILANQPQASLNIASFK